VKVSIRPEAPSEIDNAAAWYENRVAGLGMQFLRAVEGAVDQIGARPLSFARVSGDLRRCLLKRFPYLLVFGLIENDVVVLACFHGASEPFERFAEAQSRR